ncbi:MAG TPA: L-seryl-tRNA(Sec) selenium transferase [Anaerolineaceae bacterium]|nr:L-seryl-tRNA(Sec) selenium transferase [Anaerolineaceae bacterium]
MSDLRALPSVNKVLEQPEVIALCSYYGRDLVTDQIRKIESIIRQTPSLPDVNLDFILTELKISLAEIDTIRTPRLVNATGVILHTNLGRAPLCKTALEAIANQGSGYQALEFDLHSGKRGQRGEAAERLLTQLTSAEAAVVVNNNAAAIMLTLSALLKGKPVAISRGQMVEIGGGFRMPEVFRQSGAKLVEVGTTNRVRLADYQEAIEGGAKALLAVHPSNYKVTGFSEAPELKEIALLAKETGILSIFDLGSGALLDTSQFGLAHEPTVQEALAAGFDLVCFSGDKLLGGPQSGIILGSAALINKLKKHQLLRPLRADKLCLVALEATLREYLYGQALTEIPVWQMISRSLQSIQAQAQYLQNQLREGELLTGFSTIGGGSLPEETLPTTLLSFSLKPEKMLSLLRTGSPSVIARIENGRLLIDPRTIQPDEEEALLHALKISIAKLKR